MLRLKALLAQSGITQADLARAAGVHTSTLAQLLNHGLWPKTPGQDELKQKIATFLAAQEMTIPIGIFEEEPGQPASRPGNAKNQPYTGADMLMRKTGLTQQARKFHGLFRDPFAEVEDASQVFATSDIRYVREAMFQTAKHGGFLAVVGESGSGKSTLRRDLIDRISRESLPIQIVEPYVLGMEENDKKGSTLKAAGIADAIIGRLAPLASPKRTMEAKSRQVHHLLRESRKGGYAHCLVIEEAHCLPVPTLKHLKRFFELEEGFKKLLSIVLVGQPELRMRLDERNPEVREVTQRCEVITLPPLDAALEEYLRFRFEGIGKPVEEVFEADAYAAIRAKLSYTPANRSRDAKTLSLLYPLAVNNLAAAALNLCADLGLAKVNADVVREV